MMLSSLFGPVKKPIFEILYRSALRAGIQLEESGIELRTFSNRFLRLARTDKLKIEVTEKLPHLIKVWQFGIASNCNQMIIQIMIIAIVL